MVGGATCGGRGYLWWVGLLVVGGDTCGGLPVVGGAIILYIVLYLFDQVMDVKIIGGSPNH